MPIGEKEVGHLRLELWVSDKRIRSDQMEHPFPQKGHNTSKKTDGLFLNGLGHGELKVEGIGIYTFDVWEPAYSVINWTFVMLAGGLGGLIGFLLAMWTGDSGAQSGPGSNAP